MADKTKSIKGATDKELDELLTRLRKENQAQELIRDLKRKSEPLVRGYDGYETYPDLAVSTEAAIESMYHFGVPGMKWGFRKDRKTGKHRPTEDVVNNKPIRKNSADADRKNELRGKTLNEMSNEELKAFTGRLQLEKQYKELTATQVSAGQKFVNEVLTKAAKTTATTYVTKAMGEGVEKLIKMAEKSAG